MENPSRLPMNSWEEFGKERNFPTPILAVFAKGKEEENEL